MLFLKALLQSQRISEFLQDLGDEAYLRQFFTQYPEHISSKCGKGILIDSTGLPNDICIPLTAVNNHNRNISNVARLILVVDKKNSLPLYFRYAAGNIVDVSTLKTTLTELKAFGIDVDYAIIDAGYYSERNAKELSESSISFIMRLVHNRKLYKELIEKHTADLEDARNLIKYRDRLIYIKCVQIDLFVIQGYAYIAEDIDRKHDEIKKICPCSP